MALLNAKGQVGYPTSITTDAQLGPAVMGYQRPEILFGS